MQYTIILTLYNYAEVVWRDGIGQKNFVRRINSSIYVLFANLEIPVFFVVLTVRALPWSRPDNRIFLFRYART